MTAEDFARRSIAERSRAFERAYAERDADRLVDGYFAGDAHRPTAVPPRTRPVVGRAALKTLFAGLIAGAPRIRLEAVELTVSEGVAFELGRAHLLTADGDEATGRYAVCWIATEEGWRAKTDFFAEDGWTD